MIAEIDGRSLRIRSRYPMPQAAAAQAEADGLEPAVYLLAGWILDNGRPYRGSVAAVREAATGRFRPLSRIVRRPPRPKAPQSLPLFD